jgi:type IV pilus assembly protein PilZ
MGKDELAERGERGATEESVVDRRTFDRYDVEWAVDCVASDTFLYASITNISEMGIFVRTTDPLNRLREDGDNPNPGMGVRFVNLQPEERERLVEVIRTIAYLRELPQYD